MIKELDIKKLQISRVGYLKESEAHRFEEPYRAQFIRAEKEARSARKGIRSFIGIETHV